MIRMKLHLLLAETGLSQKDIADKLNIPKNTVSKYVNNSFNMINKEHLDYLCKFFHCSIDDLLEYKSEPYVHPNQIKLDLDNDSNILHEEAIDYITKNRPQKPMDMIKEFNEKYGDIEHINHPNKLNSTTFMNCFTIEEVKKDLIQNILRDVRKSITADMLQEITNDVMLEMNEYFSQYKKEFDISTKPLTKDEISHSIIDKIKSNVGDGIK